VSADREYRTLRGSLLARLEHACHSPGKWTVEGWEVWKGSKVGGWRCRKVGFTGYMSAPSFDELLQRIADEEGK
jgi:hypothetical protein